MEVRRLCRAVTGVPAAPFYEWTMAVSEVSKTSGLERLAWADLHDITRGSGFQKQSSD